MAKPKKKSKNIDEVINLLEDVNPDDLGCLRELINKFQTEQDSKGLRLEIEMALAYIHKKYDSEVYLLLRQGFQRVVEHTKKYEREFDYCDNKSLCDKECAGYDFKCVNYIALYSKRRLI